MKATKAYIASLGTTGVLLAAAVLLLGVVSAVVAFDRWPGGNVSTPVQTLVLNERPHSIRVSERSSAASATRTAAAPTAARGLAVAAPRAVDRAPSVLGENIRAGAPVTAPSTPAAPQPVQKTVGNVQDTATPLFDAVSNPGTTAGQVANGVQTATDTAGGGLSQVSPAVGQTVTLTGQSVANTVRSIPLPNNLIPGH